MTLAGPQCAFYSAYSALSSALPLRRSGERCCVSSSVTLGPGYCAASPSVVRAGGSKTGAGAAATAALCGGGARVRAAPDATPDAATGRALTIFEMPIAIITSATKLKNPKGDPPLRNGSEKTNPKNCIARNAPPMIVNLTPFDRSRWRSRSCVFTVDCTPVGRPLNTCDMTSRFVPHEVQNFLPSD